MGFFVRIRHLGGTGGRRRNRIHVSLMVQLMVRMMLLRAAIVMMNAVAIVVVICAIT